MIQYSTPCADTIIIINFIQSIVCAREKGVQGRSPCRKNDVILRRARKPLGAEESRAAPIYKGGAEPVRRYLMSIIG